MAEERRKAVRSRAATGSRGRLRSTVEVEIVDLSADGLRFELAAALRPGAIYDLQADLPGHSLAARIRVTRCAAGGFRDDGKGGRCLVYRAGAEFVWELDDEHRRVLEEFLRSREHLDGQSDFGFVRVEG